MRMDAPVAAQRDADTVDANDARIRRDGLSAAEAAARLRRDGPNRLPDAARRRWPRMLWDVLREPMLLLLLVAAGLYLVLGDAREASVLGVSVLLVIALTLYQELRSERALQALRDMSSPRARVVRDGLQSVVSAANLVVGDVLQLAEGDRVPADARLFVGEEVDVDESLLTGESLPIRRFGVDPASANAARPARDTSDGEAEDVATGRVRAGTLIVRGHAAAVVEATGARTEMGRIGVSLGALHAQPTPLQREMRRVVALFGMIAIAACVAMVVAYGALRGDWLQALLAGITLAMSNIPEEFPVVLTVFLALGGWRMARQRVLVRRPPAIEALGAVTVLCTDKTGTLTENRMALVETATPGRPAAALAPPRGRASDAIAPDIARLLESAADASESATHDPMDRAIVRCIEDLALHTLATPPLRRYPLTPGRPMYALARTTPTGLRLACKGAPETVALHCSLPERMPAEIVAALEEAARMAGRGLRVLAVAEATASTPLAPTAETAPELDDPQWRWRWCGLIGFADPLRAGVREAVQEAQSAGIRVVMLTGDHPQTARAIAVQAGIDGDPQVESGAAFAAADATQAGAMLARTRVFARVTPEHKLGMVARFRDGGAVVAMTGDGVNDAPALMAAHVGVAMGGRGTDVAREAASIVLVDDDFASVVRAVRMGRAIYDNIRRAARYIIAVHVPITGLALLPLLLDAPLVLLPLHVVFLEMIVDPACSIVFEREPPDRMSMRRPPRDPRARLIDTKTLFASVSRGLLAFACVAAVYAWAGNRGLPPQAQAACAFAALVVSNLALIAAHRGDAGLWAALRQPNPAFVVVAAAALALLAPILLLPTVAAWFGFVPPAWSALSIAVLLPPVILLGVEAVVRHRRRTPGRED